MKVGSDTAGTPDSNQQIPARFDQARQEARRRETTAMDGGRSESGMRPGWRAWRKGFRHRVAGGAASGLACARMRFALHAGRMHAGRVRAWDSADVAYRCACLRLGNPGDAYERIEPGDSSGVIDPSNRSIDARKRIFAGGHHRTSRIAPADCVIAAAKRGRRVG